MSESSWDRALYQLQQSVLDEKQLYKRFGDVVCDTLLSAGPCAPGKRVREPSPSRVVKRVAYDVMPSMSGYCSVDVTGQPQREVDRREVLSGGSRGCVQVATTPAESTVCREVTTLRADLSPAGEQERIVETEADPRVPVESEMMEEAPVQEGSPAPVERGLAEERGSLTNPLVGVLVGPFKRSEQSLTTRFREGKRSFSDRGLLCSETNCGRKGHTADFCPARRSPIDSEMRAETVEFVERLLALPQEDVHRFEGLDLSVAMRMIECRGAELNTGNPWLGSGLRKDGLRSRLGFWKAAGCDSVTLSWIAYGYKLGFQREPSRYEFKGGTRDTKSTDFVHEELESCLKDGSFKYADKSFIKVVNPIHTVPKDVDKLRMISDLRYPNSFNAYAKFTLSSLKRDLHLIVEPLDRLVVTDLSKAYYSVNMHRESWPYLGFRLGSRLVVGTVLLFGVGVAPWVFHRITRTITTLAGVLKVRVLSYLDDFLWFAREGEEGIVAAFAKWVLEVLGWKLNAKCDFEPSFEKKFLGLLINTERFVFVTPPRKMEDIQTRILSCIREQRLSGSVGLSVLETLVGKVTALELAVPGVRAWTRGLYKVIGKARFRQETVPLTEEAVEELLFLGPHLRAWATKGWFIRSSRDTFLDVYTDAGEFGLGGWAVLPDGERVEFSTMYQDARIVGKSSCFRELFGVARVAEAFVEHLRGRKVRFVMDAAAAVRNMCNQGGKVPELIELYKAWVQFCITHRIEAYFVWVPREENVKADELSKKITLNVQLSQTALTCLHQSRVFSSAQLELLRTPDFNVIGHVLDKLRSARAEALLVIPVFPSKGWYPVLIQAAHRAGNVSMMLPTADVSFQDMLGKPCHYPRWKVRALFVSFV